jgi:hypothetical protein
MFRVSRQRVYAGIGILMLLATTTGFCQSVFGQSSNQSTATTSSEETASGQSSSGQFSSGQSLAAVARASQEKKAAQGATTPPKVITNADLPKNPGGYTGPPAEEEERSTPAPGNTARETAQRRAMERAGAQWRQQIVTQTNKIAMLQTRIVRLRAQIHVVDPNANYDEAAGTSYNGAQATQIRILKDMEEELRQQQQQLQDMQEAARRAGMHTTVYDP